MLYYLFEYLERVYQFPGASLFGYLSFRSAVAIIFSLLVTAVLGKRIIAMLQHHQMGETIRDLGLSGQQEKEGTPTMGGLMIIFGTLIPVLLLTKLDNIYILLLIATTVWMGIIGFIDDYLKIKRKDKEGLKGRFKIVGQVTLGLIIGATLYFHPEVTIKQQAIDSDSFLQEEKSTKTTIPLFKNNEFDYSDVITWAGAGAKDYAWLIFIPAVIFIITAVSNGANLTDGIDGLAAGTASIAVLTLGLFAWVSGNIIFANYLNVMYIPQVSEVVVFVAAFVGALVGFLWYNAYPAQVFMGDTGSLTIGGVIAVLAIIVRKELLIPVLCGVFLIENLSVVLQVSYFKYSKKRLGVGKRIFKMAPLVSSFREVCIVKTKA
jgi:phospho-N-acetylmuramoyl-pentapeptide-transferase